MQYQTRVLRDRVEHDSVAYVYMYMYSHNVSPRELYEFVCGSVLLYTFTYVYVSLLLDRRLTLLCVRCLLVVSALFVIDDVC